MDFNFSETAQAVAELAERLLADKASPDRVKVVESGPDGWDRDLWDHMAESGLLALAVPEADGGSGLGLIETCTVLVAQGRHVAPVPLWPTVALGLPALTQYGTAEQKQKWLPEVLSGRLILTAALEGAHSSAPGVGLVQAQVVGDSWVISGRAGPVPYGAQAGAIIVAAQVSADTGTDASREPGLVAGSAPVELFIVESRAPGMNLEPVQVTDRSPHAWLDLDGVVVGASHHLATGNPDGCGGRAALEALRHWAVVGQCALAVGVAEGAMAMTAAYVSERHQFGKPLATFQAVALRLADCYIDTEAMRVTMWQAAWRISEGLAAAEEVAVAQWWSADACQRVVHATQHLHGGVGADIDYPVHRYFLWGKQIEQALGGASAQLEELGRLIATRQSTTEADHANA
ncbi:MAG: acyl-CoA dehydrogenase family protein [Acidimicrobiales bacterium]